MGQMNEKNRKGGCKRCRDKQPLGIDISMAFQPIVELSSGRIFAHEALVRGVNGEPAGEVFKYVDDDNLYQFDQTCRIKAIELAARIGVQSHVSINFMPNAVYQAETCIQRALEAAERYGLPLENIIFEVTEADRVPDRNHLRNILEYYKKRGFKTAIDDFGDGYAGLNLMADFVPDLVKLDMGLIRDIDSDKQRHLIVRHIVRLCEELGPRVIAEGVETRAERDTLRDLGVDLFQGYYFAKPAFEAKAALDPESLK